MSVQCTCTSMQCTRACACACRACTCTRYLLVLYIRVEVGFSSALFCDFDFCPRTHKPNCPMRDSIKSYKHRRTNQCANGRHPFRSCRVLYEALLESMHWTAGPEPSHEQCSFDAGELINTKFTGGKENMWALSPSKWPTLPWKPSHSTKKKVQATRRHTATTAIYNSFLNVAST